MAGDPEGPAPRAKKARKEAEMASSAAVPPPAKKVRREPPAEPSSAPPRPPPRQQRPQPPPAAAAAEPAPPVEEETAPVADLAGVAPVVASAPDAPAAPTAAAPAAAAAAAAAAPVDGASAAAAPLPAKKARKARAPPPPEYEEIWRDVYLSGTEWEQQRQVLEYDWDFSHLDEALMSGALKDAPMVHLFGATEPQLVITSEDDVNGSVVPIPVIVAVVSTRPPPAVVGIKSIQRTDEEIVPMANLRISWNARPPDNASKRNVPAGNVFVLKCSERKARLRNMEEAAVHKYDYVLPYIFRPGQVSEDEQDTNVQVLVDNLEGRSNPVMLDFDYEMDDLDEFVAEQIGEQDLDADKHTEPVKEAIRAAVKAQKLKHKTEKDARKARLDEISNEERESMANMKLYKFYPSNEEDKYPDVTPHKSKYINRYYGQADFVC